MFHGQDLDELSNCVKLNKSGLQSLKMIVSPLADNIKNYDNIFVFIIYYIFTVD